MSSVYRLREGKVVWVEVHGHYDKALEADGLKD
jgi:hypothetical protein